MSDDTWWAEQGVWLPRGANPVGVEPLKCVCGTTITMGKEDDPMFHSDYCPVYKEYVERKKHEKTN